MDNLTPKRRIFVEAYLITGNGAEAARKAGYASASARQEASRLLRDRQIRALVTSRIGASVQQIANRETVCRGCVYVLRADNGLIKIGKTRDLRQRLMHFNGVLPYDLERLFVFECADYGKLETYLLRCFAQQRVRGEWFRLSSDEIARIPGIVHEWMS